MIRQQRRSGRSGDAPGSSVILILFRTRGDSPSSCTALFEKLENHIAHVRRGFVGGDAEGRALFDRPESEAQTPAFSLHVDNLLLVQPRLELARRDPDSD